MTTCPQCDANDGWANRIGTDGVKRFVRCDHGKRRDSGLGAGDSGFEKINEVIHRNIESVVSSRLVLRVRDLIVTRRGQANAIRIADIKAALPELDDRKVKDAVEELRMIAGLPIAATKVPPYGYFIPQTAEEFDQMFERHRREGIKHFRVARLFRPHADVVEMLRGQMPLEDLGFRIQDSANPKSQILDPKSCSSQESA